MEDFIILQEIIFVIESLLALIYFFSISNILLLLKINKGLDKTSKVYLSSFVYSMLPVLIFIAVEQVFFMSGRVRFAGDSGVLFSGTMLLFYLPVLLFVIQKIYVSLRSFILPVLLSAGLFGLNMAMVYMVKTGVGNMFIANAIQLLFNVMVPAAVLFHFYLLRGCFSQKSCFDSLKTEIGETTLSLLLSYPLILLVVFVLHLVLPQQTLLYLSVIFFARIFAVIVNLVLLAEVIRGNSGQVPGNYDYNIAGIPREIMGGDKKGSFGVEYDDELLKRLMDFFEPEKPYLNPKLTINELAVNLYTNKTYLSGLINRHFKMNFSQFLNYYRVKEAQRLFKENSKLSMRYLCDMSGFGSMASFNIAFRLFSGCTPAEWCRDQKIRMRNEKGSGENGRNNR